MPTANVRVSSIAWAASYSRDEGAAVSWRRWHSFRASANSHAPSRSGWPSHEISAAAMTKVSRTASVASAGSVSCDRQ